MQSDWPFAILYSLLFLFFSWLLFYNVRAVLKRKHSCRTGCFDLDLFKRKKEQQDD